MKCFLFTQNNIAEERNTNTQEKIAYQMYRSDNTVDNEKAS